MAYMSQEKKNALMPGIKAVLEKYKIKGSVRVHHHTSLDVTLKSGAINFEALRVITPAHHPADEWKGYAQVNEYYIDSGWTGDAAQFLTELKAALNVGNHDRSDIMTDYFDVGWYIHINIGRWNKPYTWAGNE